MNILGVFTLIKREIQREYRFFGISMAGPALQAALFIGVFAIVLADDQTKVIGLDYIEFIAIGFMTTTTLQKSYEAPAFSLLFDKLEGNISDLIGAPINGFEIVISYIFATFVISGFIGGSAWAVLYFIGGPTGIHNPFTLISSFIIGSALFSTLGMIGGIIAEKWDKLSAQETFIITPLMLLSGSFFPRQSLPENWHFLLDYNPVFRLIDTMRYSFTGQHELSVNENLLISGIWLLLFGAICIFILSKGYKLKP